MADLVGHLTKFNQNGDYNFLVNDFAPRYYLPILSDPTDEDTDNDGADDNIDPEPLIKAHIKPFGTDEYFTEVKRETQKRYQSKSGSKEKTKIDFYNYDWSSFYKIRQEQLINASAFNGISDRLEDIQIQKIENAKISLDIMMKDVNDCELYLKSVSDENWLRFCEFFNECVQEYGTVDEELHYFRLKLNRTPSSFAELIANRSEWEIYSKDNTRYHMNNGQFESSNKEYPDCLSYNNEYNMKFVNKNGLYEVIVSPKHEIRGMNPSQIEVELNNPINWVILTADLNINDDNFRYDPVNVGTYNYYASLPSYGLIKKGNASIIHHAFDVQPFYTWGNVKGLPYGNSIDEREANGFYYRDNANKDVYISWSDYWNE